MAEEQEIDLSHLDLDLNQSAEQTLPEDIILPDAGEEPTPEVLETPVEPTLEQEQDNQLEQDPPLPPRSEVIDSSLEQDQPELEEEEFTGYSDEDVLGYLSEKLGRQVQSFEEFNQPEAPEPYADEDPEVAQFREFKQSTGRGLDDYMKLQALDLTGMSDTDIAKEILQMKYPSLSQSELNFELQQYVPTEDDAYADETDKIRKSVALKKLIAEGLPQLEQLKQQYQTPVEQPTQQTDNTAAAEAEAQQFREASLAAAKELEGIRFKLDDKLNLDFRLHSDQANQLGDFMQMEHWRDQQGNVQHDRMMMDYAILQNIDTIVQEAYKQGMNAGIAREDRNERNITLTKDRPTFEGNVPSSPDIVVEAPNTGGGFSGQLKVRKFGNS